MSLESAALKPRRFRRMITVVLISALAAYLLLNTGFAWMYVNGLTKPVCQESNPIIAAAVLPQELWLTTSDNLRLRAVYYPPENGAVILAFGGIGGALGDALPPVRFLLEAGYGVLQVDSRGCAQPRAPVTLGANEIRDAAASLDFLSQQPEVNHVGAIGFSMGGVTAIRSAARYPAIEAIVAEGGYYNLAGDLTNEGNPTPLYQRIFLSTIAGLFRLRTGVNPWQVSPIEDLPRINPRPVYLIYGEHEAASGHAQDQFAAARQPKQFWLVPGGAHGSNHIAAPQQYKDSILDFFDRNLLK
jgi:dipeptidyl aminopeptidase/acylaminoacyl peptidase